MSDDKRTSYFEVAFKSSSSESPLHGRRIDTGATSHMTNGRGFFTQHYQEEAGTVTVANGQQVGPGEVGNGHFNCQITQH